MTTTEFSSFESVKKIAAEIAFSFKLSVEIMRTQSGYRIVPDELQPENLQDFATNAYTFGLKEWLLDLLQYVDTQHFQSTDLVWHDQATGLVWDVSRTVYRDRYSEHPTAPVHIMNKIRYGGRDNWRLPTLSELKTLSMEKLTATGMLASSNSLKLWADEESFYTGPEKALFDLVSQRRSDQRYIEEHKDRSGGRYTERAQTMLVSSSTDPK